MSVEIINENTIEVLVEPTPIVEITVESNPIVEIEILPGGVVGVPANEDSLSIDAQLRLNIIPDYLAPYKEFTYTGSNLTAIQSYESPSKAIHLRSVTLSYSGSNLASKVVTDIRTGRSLTTTYTTVDGNLTVISESFSG